MNKPRKKIKVVGSRKSQGIRHKADGIRRKLQKINELN